MRAGCNNLKKNVDVCIFNLSLCFLFMTATFQQQFFTLNNILLPNCTQNYVQCKYT